MMYLVVRSALDDMGLGFRLRYKNYILDGITKKGALRAPFFKSYHLVILQVLLGF